jgi:hypothetical protein
VKPGSRQKRWSRSVLLCVDDVYAQQHLCFA